MIKFEILIDHSETSNKCTILPLAYRSDFKITKFPRQTSSKPPELHLHSELLLHPAGHPINEYAAAHGPFNGSIAAIDSIWRRLDPIMQAVAKPLPTLVGLPSGFVTAYPRVSRHDFDPEGGLATIEALFIAAALVGHWDESLLSEYFFGQKFLELNAGRFADFGVVVPTERSEPLFKPLIPRNAHSRRRGRGRDGAPRPLAINTSHQA